MGLYFEDHIVFPRLQIISLGTISLHYLSFPNIFGVNYGNKGTHKMGIFFVCVKLFGSI